MNVSMPGGDKPREIRVPKYVPNSAILTRRNLN